MINPTFSSKNGIVENNILNDFKGVLLTRVNLTDGSQPKRAAGVASQKLETPQKLENNYSKRYSY